jgi:hypothetical protein
VANVPEQLAVLFAGDPVFDVVGAEPPFVVTPEWLELTKAKIAKLVDRPALGKVSANNKYFKQGTPLLVDTSAHCWNGSGTRPTSVTGETCATCSRPPSPSSPSGSALSPTQVSIRYVS